MRKTEAKLWDRLRPRLAAHRIYAERIENVVGEGTPDLHTAHHGANGPFAAWIELKAVECWPARDTTPVMGSRTQIRKAQRVWHHKYTLSGGKSYLLLGVGAQHVYLIRGCDILECDRWTRPELAACAVSGWDAILATLKGEA